MSWHWLDKDHTTAQLRRGDIEGILNGLPPYKADYVFDDHYKPDTDSPDDAYDAVQWCVLDAEGSILARVEGGEEMAVFFARKLNELAGLITRLESRDE